MDVRGNVAAGAATSVCPRAELLMGDDGTVGGSLRAGVDVLGTPMVGNALFGNPAVTGERGTRGSSGEGGVRLRRCSVLPPLAAALWPLDDVHAESLACRLNISDISSFVGGCAPSSLSLSVSPLDEVVVAFGWQRSGPSLRFCQGMSHPSQRNFFFVR